MFGALIDELVGCSDAELVERIEQNELERRRLDAEMSAALAIAQARNVHGIDGHRSMSAFCRAKLNWSSTEAGRRLGLARAVDQVDGLGEAWAAGRIGLPQALKLSITNGNKRVAERLPDFAPKLLVHAEQMPYRHFAQTVDHFVKQADTEGAHDDRDAATDGRSGRVVGVGSCVDIRVTGGDGLVAAELIAIHDRFADIEFRNDVEANRLEYGDDAQLHPLPRTSRQRGFDATVAIYRAAATVGNVSTVAEPLVNIAIDAATWGKILLANSLTTSTDLDGAPVDPFTGLPTEHLDGLVDDLTDPASRMCESSNGVQLDPRDVLQAALAGHVRRVVVDAEHVVIDLGRRQRLFTGNARQAAAMLIATCEHAGCEVPADWCDVDHDREWVRDRGPTDQRNAAVLCRSHNNDKHHRRWRTRRATNGCSYTIRADGSIVLPVGARPPVFASEAAEPDVESPEHFAHTAVLTRNRIDDLVRNQQPTAHVDSSSS